MRNSAGALLLQGRRRTVVANARRDDGQWAADCGADTVDDKERVAAIERMDAVKAETVENAAAMATVGCCLGPEVRRSAGTWRSFSSILWADGVFILKASRNALCTVVRPALHTDHQGLRRSFISGAESPALASAEWGEN